MSDIIARLRRYTGQDRRDVSNPCITAREAIEIANHIHSLEQPCNCELVVSLRKSIAALENKLTECRGFDCCPLASKLNAADDRIDELEKVCALSVGVANNTYSLRDDIIELKAALRDAGYGGGE